jgi:hypothetical protein
VTSSIANVAAIQTGDIIYDSPALNDPFAGGTFWYGASNVQGQFGADYAFFIFANGTVNTISNCTASPTPTPTPTNSNPPFTNIEVRECGTSSPTYDIRVNGDYSNPSSVGLALTISSGGGTGGCPTFNGTKCWEITVTNQGFYNCTATVSATYASCGACTPVTPTPTPTVTVSPSQQSPTPTPTISNSQTPTPTISNSPTPTPTLSYDYWLITPCPGGGAGGAYSSVRIPTGVGATTGNSVLMPDGCYNIDEPTGSSNTNDYITVYSNCSTCLSANPTPTPTPTISNSATPTQTPTNTPTPTPSLSEGGSQTPTPTPTVTPSITPSRSVVTCIAIDVHRGSNTTDGCCSDPLQPEYFNANSLASATRHYTGLGCISLSSGTKYFSEDGNTYYEFFNGVKTGSGTCPACP